MSFPCTMCGCCCERVGKIVPRLEEMGVSHGHPLHFPYRWDESGACEKLIDNRCSVYNDRPLICNIDHLTAAMGKPVGSRYAESIKACNKMMNDDNIDQSFRIPED